MLAFLASLIPDCSWRKAFGESSLVVTRDDAVAGDEENRRSCFIHVAAVLITVLSPGSVSASDAEQGKVIRFDISRQRADQALIEFAEQADVTFIFPAAEARKVTANAVRGEFTPEEAITRLLQGTGLRPGFNASGAWTVKTDDNSNQGDAMKPRGLLAAVVAALTGAGHANAQELAGAELARTTLEEIVVTAQKRSERLQDVPASISAISGERLEALQVSSLSDLSGYVPSLTLSNYGAPGFNTIEIRGLGSGYLVDFVGPLVSTYIDDVPVGSSTAAGRGNLFGLDLMPYDIERVEVLKGPQGTLYGGNAMGGLIKYAMRKPSLTEFEARAGSSVQYTDDSANAGWGARAAVSVPLVTDRLGLRVSAFHQDNAGYIDNLGIGVEDSNQSTQESSRASLLWQATDRLSVQATVLAQDVEADDLTNVTLNGSTLTPLYGPRATSTKFPQTIEQKTRSYSASVNWELGFANWTSTAGWSDLDTTLKQDYSDPFAAFAGPPVELARFEIYAHASKFVGETRLASAEDARTQWLVGGYYTDEDAGEENNWPTFTGTYDPLATNLFIKDEAFSYEEAALFANVTRKLTERFELGGGVRYSSYDQSGCVFSTGVFGTNSTVCRNPPSEGVTTWMANARFHVNRDAMVYVRAATGYRAGATNAPPDVLLGAPAQAKSDQTVEYEIGFKGELLDGRLQVDASVFHIDWKDMQIQQRERVSESPPRDIIFVGNAGSAVSDGLELSAIYQATPGLRLNATVAYTDARLTDDALEAGGRDGDQLPLSARWAGSLTANYSRPIGARTTLNFGGGYRHRDAVAAQFPGIAPFLGPPADRTAPIPPWNILDLYVGVELNKLGLQLYGRNIFDHRSYAGLQFLNNVNVPRFIPIEPPTVGLSVEYRF